MLAAPAIAQNLNLAPDAAPSRAVQEPLPPGVAPVPLPDPSYKPGFLDVLGHWLGQSRAHIDSQLKTTQDALKTTQDAIGDLGSQATANARDAADAAQQATGAIVGGLPATRIVTGRQRCVIAPNGGADCSTAADALCRGRGFGAGRGLDVHSVEKCPSWVWLAGRSNIQGPCPTETYVTRALCQ